MKLSDKKELSKSNESDKQPLVKIIVMIIIIIIIIILLLTSCTSGFWGRIGDLFKGSSSYEVDPGNSETEKIYNKDLKFITASGTTLLDNVYKIEFATDKVSFKTFTCTTSKADIATCVVKGNYVEVYPKSEGEVTISVIGKGNGKEYIGTHKLLITKQEKSITLSSYSGELYLEDTSIQRVYYNLNNIEGEVTVSSNDDSVATASVKNGVLVINAKKPGKVTVTVTVVSNGYEYKTSYNLTVKDKKNVLEVKSSENRLSSLKISNVSLNPKFSSDITEYHAEVGESVDKISLSLNKKDDKSKVYYYVNGSRVESLNNVHLNYGNNDIEIVVQAENNKTRKYTIHVNRAQSGGIKPTPTPGVTPTPTPTPVPSDVNTLDSLVIEGYDLKFNPTTNFYELTVRYDTSSLTVTSEKTHSSSTVSYDLNGSSDLTNLKEGMNNLKVVVTSESGKNNTYEIAIKKPIRKIVLSQDKNEILMENSPLDIIYQIYEDKELNGSFYPTEDYKLSDIVVTIPNFEGSYSVSQGTITIMPSNGDVSNTYTLTANYLGKMDLLKFDVKMESYSITTKVDNYKFDYVADLEDMAISFNTNIFNNDMLFREIANGIELYNHKGSVTIISSNPDILKVKYSEDDNKVPGTDISFRNEIKDGGEVDIIITGTVYGKTIGPKTIHVTIHKKFKVTIDALDGFFDSFTAVHSYLAEPGEMLKLSEYVPYKVDKTGNCLYYSIESYNTKADGSGQQYNKDAEIVVNSDITLYAVYTSTSKFEDIKDEGIMYLTEVDLFHNDEYYKQHNIDKIIYPTAHGSHAMYIKNNTVNIIEITNVNLTENTTCIDKLGCINMGYIIKYTKEKDTNWKFYYGSENNYKILNLDNEVVRDTTNGYENSISVPNASSVHNDSIILNPGEDVTISLLWEWVDVNDELDTKIGNITSDQDYSITVSIEYKTTNQYCTLNSTNPSN